MRARAVVVGVVSVVVVATCVWAARPPMAPCKQYAQWKQGPSGDPSFFPIGVWCQSPRNARKYEALGINVYVGLHGGPTEDDLAKLKKAGMKTICDQNAVGLKHLDDPTIIGWMHGDEPDNCKQVDGKWVPVARPKEIVAQYKRFRKRDPTRPVLLNLGQGVANPGYKGSWVRDDKEYVNFAKGCDILSFDVYPVTGQRPETNDKLHLVAFGVDRLYKFSGGKKIVWNVVECSKIRAPRRATPREVRAEVWMSLIHGSTGLVYFCHEFEPNKGGETALLGDEEMCKALTEINGQIRDLAPVLNSPTVKGIVKSARKDVPVDIMVKRHDDAVYVFAAAMRPGKTKAGFRVGIRGKAFAEVLGENRFITANGGRFTDIFNNYDVHLYKITPGEKPDEGGGASLK